MRAEEIIKESLRDYWKKRKEKESKIKKLIKKSKQEYYNKVPHG